MVTKPVSVWSREIQVSSFSDLFASLGKAAINGATGQWSNLGGDAVDAASKMGLTLDPGQRAWLLIYRALGRAVSQLLESNQPLLAEEPRRNEVSKEIEQALAALDDLELVIDASFFENPKQSPLLDAFRGPFAQWLGQYLESSEEARAIASRLPSYFVFALYEEWRDRSQDYAEIQAQLDTPFTKAESRERAWQAYRAWLQRQVELPMFTEAFGLKSVFVEPNAYYLKRKSNATDFYGEDSKTVDSNSQVERCVVSLMVTLMEWVETAGRNDAIRMICGGPGCGKSSFTKVVAAKLADENPELPLLFIPLHQFDPKADLVEAVDQFIENDPDGILPPNPLAKEARGQKVLLIFDGLDELALQGKVGAEVAQQFVREVLKRLDRFNTGMTTSPKLLALISGRELVVQANQTEFRREGQILHMLPYYLSEQERKAYQDPGNLLEQDHRDYWWRRYGAATGQDYQVGMPWALKLNNLTEITAQPLLNYLVALSYSRGELQVSSTSNLNEIYGDLLNNVYDRGWDEKRLHPGTQGMRRPEFKRILEEIALAAWHGDGRTTTVREIATHCKNSGLERLLQTFQTGASQGVTRLLTAFYFRQSGQRESEKTFEFTHKSFGEYLTARRIVGEVKRIHRDLVRREQHWDEGCDEKEALERWSKLCGPTKMDKYLFRFICDEICLLFSAKDGTVQVQAWQSTLSRLMKVMLGEGMPMEKLSLPDFQVMNEQAKHAEEALLVVMNACARCTQTASEVQWPNDDKAIFGAWFARIQGQRTERKDKFLILDGTVQLKSEALKAPTQE